MTEGDRFYERGKILRCVDCGANFDFFEGEQRFFAAKGFPDPVRCKECRRRRREAHGRAGLPGRPQEPRFSVGEIAAEHRGVISEATNEKARRRG